jgi:phospholipid/cholesterol/gamma-HCH transport system permease protein
MVGHASGAAAGNPVTLLGRFVISTVREAGDIVLFGARVFKQYLAKAGPRGVLARQCGFVGWESVPIVLLTAFFTGGVLALQSFNGIGGGTLANNQLGKLVALSMLRELGPVLGALMLSSRVGAAMAAELGTMRVTEQIDALVTLAADPLRYLVVPRILACLLMLPVLVVLANVMGIFGGYEISTHVLGVPGHLYMTTTYDAIKTIDLEMAIVKAAVFGTLVGLMATYHGFNARGGAEGVGRATTQAVVYAAVAILVADYFITALMM